MIKFNTLLELVDIDPVNVRLVRNHDTGKGGLRSCYDLWLSDDGTYDYYQRIQKFRKFKVGQTIASFIVTPQKDTLFVGLYSVGDIKKAPKVIECPIRGKQQGLFIYDLDKMKALSEYEGLIIVDWGKGGRAWVQRADRQNKNVLEVRRQFKEPDFPGFANFCTNIVELQSIPEQWKTVLRSVSGVYFLVCNETGKQYIGSAYGSDGIWGRWCDYARNGHGGNAQLKKLNFRDCQATVLEVIDPAARDADVIAIENHWKKKLQTRKFGLNEN